LISSVVKDKFKVMQVFINEIVKVDFLLAFFLFFTFFLHFISFKLYNSNDFSDLVYNKAKKKIVFVFWCDKID
jgi:hypothetical protein